MLLEFFKGFLFNFFFVFECLVWVFWFCFSERDDGGWRFFVGEVGWVFGDEVKVVVDCCFWVNVFVLCGFGLGEESLCFSNIEGKLMGSFNGEEGMFWELCWVGCG